MENGNINRRALATKVNLIRRDFKFYIKLRMLHQMVPILFFAKGVVDLNHIFQLEHCKSLKS